MKNKIIKIILLVAIILATFNNYYVQAMVNPLENPDRYKPTYDNPTGETALVDMVGGILGVINTIGVVVATITLMIIGIKYMAGSVEEKAEYKKTIMIYVIGAILTFSVTTIPNIIYNIAIKI